MDTVHRIDESRRTLTIKFIHRKIKEKGRYTGAEKIIYNSLPSDRC